MRVGSPSSGWQSINGSNDIDMRLKTIKDQGIARFRCETYFVTRIDQTQKGGSISKMRSNQIARVCTAIGGCWWSKLQIRVFKEEAQIRSRRLQQFTIYEQDKARWGRKNGPEADGEIHTTQPQ